MGTHELVDQAGVPWVADQVVVLVITGLRG